MFGRQSRPHCLSLLLFERDLFYKIKQFNASSSYLQYHIGCSGWSYSAWQGPFYPLKLENTKWLSYYSHVFDFVEIDSTFYRIPNAFMVKNWCKKTPNHFRFTAKFPKVITHDKRLKDVEKELELFFSSMIYLEDKILALLIQLSPSMGVVEGMNRLRDIIHELDKRFRYAIEVRDSSWFQDLAAKHFLNCDSRTTRHPGYGRTEPLPI